MYGIIDEPLDELGTVILCEDGRRYSTHPSEAVNCPRGTLVRVDQPLDIAVAHGVVVMFEPCLAVHERLRSMLGA